MARSRGTFVPEVNTHVCKPTRTPLTCAPRRGGLIESDAAPDVILMKSRLEYIGSSQMSNSARIANVRPADIRRAIDRTFEWS